MTSPKRWAEPDSTCSEELRGLLRAARADVPDERCLRSMAVGLGPILGVGAGPVVSSGAAASVGLKMGAVALVMVAAAGGIVARSYWAPQAPESRLSSVTLGPRAPAPAPAASRLPTDVPGKVATRLSLPPPTRPPDPPITQPQRASSALPQSPPTLVHPRTVETPVAEIVERREVEPPDVPSPPTEAAPIAAAEEWKPPSAQPWPATELALVRKAQDALRSTPAAALSLADELAARFPAGVLSQEREVIAIEALIELRRPDEARARAARLLGAVPGTAYRPRVEALLGGAIDASTHKP